MTTRPITTFNAARWTRWLLAAILLAGAAVRVHGAWRTRVITDPDGSVVALMAKHMALGLDYPVFFYGQLYMGSLEPAVSALLCRIFGVSGFMVNLGTALVGILLLPVVYRWGRDAGGRVAGLAAAAFCIIGSPKFIMYQFTPRGGYAAVVVLGALVLWLAARLAAQREGPHGRACWMLGLAAGLGWWVDPLIAMALAAAVIVLLVGLRAEALRPRFFMPGLAGFFIGGAPFWIWNAFHHGVGITALLTAKRSTFAEGAAAFVRQGQRVTGLDGLSAGWWWASLIVLIAALVYAAVNLVRAVKRQSLDRSTLSLSAALAMLVVTFLMYSTSQFSRENTARYLTPMIPALAVLVGCFIAACARRHPVLPLIPIAVLAVMQWPQRVDLTRVHEREKAVKTLAPLLSELFAVHGIDTAYIEFTLYPLNFHTDEAFNFPLLEHERAYYMAEWAERDPSPAYMTMNRELVAFVNTAGGSYERLEFDVGSLLYRFRPPVFARAVLPVSAIAGGAVSSDPVAEVKAITDHRRGTRWTIDPHTSQGGWAEVQFNEPREVNGVRLVLPDHKTRPIYWSVEGRREDGEWVTLLEKTEFTLFYWSGPRAHLGARFVRVEAMFDPARVTALRLVFPPDPASRPFSLAEVQVMVPAEPIVAETADLVPELVALLERRGIDTLFADRWIANEVWLHTQGAITTTREEPRRPDTPYKPRPTIEGRPGLGLLVRLDGVESTRAVLREAGFTHEETAIGPWILFDALAGSSVDVEWAGFSALFR